MAKIGTRLGREDWLRQALQVLEEDGVHGIRVERVARDLGVTKGSFYWHFRDHDDLLQSVLDYWSDAFNDRVIENPELLSADPNESLVNIIEFVQENDLDRYELAMRAWAETDTRVAKVVKDVYARRFEFVKFFFHQHGFSELQTEARARLLLCYLSWEPSLLFDEDKRRRNELRRLYHEILTKK